MQLEIWEMKTAGIVLIVAMLSFIHKTNGFRAFGAGTRQVVSRFMASAESETSEKETGHQTGGAAGMPELSDQDKAFVTKFQEHQKSAARLTNAEEVRTLIENSNGYGVLSTNSKQYDGYPTGSVVGFSLDDDGHPFFVFSSMSAHTQDVAEDKRVSLTVMANDFKGAAEGRVVLIGDVVPLEEDKKAMYRELYMKRHPDAFWIDFGDFSYWSLNNLSSLRYIGGFARAGSLKPSEYLEAEPDPVAPFASPVMAHMNDDHTDSTAEIVRKCVGVPVKDATMVGLDSLGMTVKCTMDFAGGGVTKVRVPWSERVTDRPGIKQAIVKLLKSE